MVALLVTAGAADVEDAGAHLVTVAIALRAVAALKAVPAIGAGDSLDRARVAIASNRARRAQPIAAIRACGGALGAEHHGGASVAA